MTLDTSREACEQADRKDFGRREVSPRGEGDKFAFAISGESKTRADIVPREVGKVVEDVGLAHAGGQVFQDVIHRNAQSKNTRLPTALGRIDGYAILIGHDGKRTSGVPEDQGRENGLSNHCSPPFPAIHGMPHTGCPLITFSSDNGS